MNRIFYLNSLFDLELGEYPIRNVEQASAEMTVLFAPLASKDDQILLDIDVRDEYWKYLDNCGLEMPHRVSFTQNGNEEGSLRGEAWGWNKNVADLLKRAGAECYFPDTEIVKKVNSRRYSSYLAQKHGWGVPGSVYLPDLHDYTNALVSLNDHYPLVIKPSYGGSGFGFKKIDSFCEGSNFTNDIAYLSAHGGYVIEPWLDRVYDLSSRVEIANDGSISFIRFQRSCVNSFGAFYGIYIPPQDLILKQYEKELESNALKVADELYSLGYWGPVGIDSFVYRDRASGCQKLVCAIEINARHVMSDVSFALRDSCAPKKHCLFRFVSKKRGRVPDNYCDLKKILGKEMYDPVTQKGIIVVSPLNVFYKNKWNKPLRNVFFLAADSEPELLVLDKILRERLKTK
ncbi:MAG: hypothetical protein Q4F84_03685 [Fibrobacter sp.]|nr:hypothetical protein [Fibrobacter sp.]